MADLTKRQHYVPRFLLEHFVENDSGQVFVYDGEAGKVLPPHKPVHAMMKNYFYDRDNQIENYLAASIEGPVASLLQDIVGASALPSHAPCIELFRFLGVQQARTPAARDEHQHLQKQMLNTVADHFLQANGYGAEAINEIDVEIGNVEANHASRIMLGDVSSFLWTDLSMVLLINQTETPFIMGDHPVVQYNWYLREHDQPGSASMTAPGVQVFLPLSPRHSLMLYDAGVYDMELTDDAVVSVVSADDVGILNDMQCLARERFLVANSDAAAAAVQDRAETLEPKSLTRFSTGTMPGRMQPNGLRSEFIWSHRSQLKLPQWLSFCTVNGEKIGRELKTRHRDKRMVEEFEILQKSVLGYGVDPTEQ